MKICGVYQQQKTPSFRMDLVNADSAIEMMCPNSMKTSKVLAIAEQATEGLKGIGDSEKVELMELGQRFMLAYKNPKFREICEPLDDFVRVEDENYTFDEVLNSILTSLTKAANKLHNKYLPRVNKQAGSVTIAPNAVPKPQRIK